MPFQLSHFSHPPVSHVMVICLQQPAREVHVVSSDTAIMSWIE